MLVIGDYQFEFLKRPETDWGNGLFKPISCCRITSILDNQWVGYGCAYCDEILLEQVFNI